MGCVGPLGLKPQALYAHRARLKSCPFKSSMLLDLTFDAATVQTMILDLASGAA